jgi:hypothetical protein
VQKTEERNLVVTKTSEYQLQKLDQMRRGLKRYINKRKKDFAEEYVKFRELNTMDGELIPSLDRMPMNDIIEHTFAPLIKVAGFSPTYSADEMAIAFDFYVECSQKLNKTAYYVPKTEDFCRMINISRNMFDRWQTTSSDENMREICNKINDYCSARLADTAFSSKDKAIVTYSIFHQKASNKMRDNDPIQNNTYIQNNTIMSDEQFNDLASKYSN